jgi:hypothetical protein
MKKLFGVLGAAVLLTGGALPALAQMDVATMTCGAYYAMDAAGRTEATNAIMNFVKDTANAGTVAAAAQLMGDMPAAEVQPLIDKACEGQTVDTSLISVLK